jgi:hypothetical protein
VGHIENRTRRRRKRKQRVCGTQSRARIDCQRVGQNASLTKLCCPCTVRGSSRFGGFSERMRDGRLSMTLRVVGKYEMTKIQSHAHTKSTEGQRGSVRRRSASIEDGGYHCITARNGADYGNGFNSPGIVVVVPIPPRAVGDSDQAVHATVSSDHIVHRGLWRLPDGPVLCTELPKTHRSQQSASRL